MNNTIVEYKIKNNNSSLGVEILDFEYDHIFDDARVSDLRNLWLNYSIIIFKDLKLSHQQLENFSLAFGNFGNDPYIDSIDGHDNIIEVRREADEKAPPFGASWHSDWSFQECPPSATLLHSKIIPPTGGDTFFINTHEAYADLSNDINSLEDLNNKAFESIENSTRPVFDNLDKPSNLDGIINISDPIITTSENSSTKALFYTGEKLYGDSVTERHSESISLLGSKKFIEISQNIVDKFNLTSGKCSMVQDDMEVTLSYKINDNLPDDLIYIPINRRDLNKFNFSKEITFLPSRVEEALNVN